MRRNLKAFQLSWYEHVRPTATATASCGCVYRVTVLEYGFGLAITRVHECEWPGRLSGHDSKTYISLWSNTERVRAAILAGHGIAAHSRR